MHTMRLCLVGVHRKETLVRLDRKAYPARRRPVVTSIAQVCALNPCLHCRPPQFGGQVFQGHWGVYCRGTGGSRCRGRLRMAGDDKDSLK